MPENDASFPAFWCNTNEKAQIRPHYQAQPHHPEPEKALFCNPQRKIQAEKVLERVLKTMAKKYSRSDEFHHVEDFKLPWEEYFS